MESTIFLTGATGSVGKRVLQKILQYSTHNVVVLVRSSIALKEFAGELSVGRVEILYGDITKINFGLDPEKYTELTRRVKHIIHAAASTKFNLPLAEARKVNVEGTHTVLAFAKGCPHLDHFAFLSTVFVAGKFTGVVHEELLTDEYGFVNSYEQSKYEAEHLVRKHIPKASIYRLSTIFGDSKTGVVDHFTAPHQALRIMRLGMATMVPGRPDYIVDLIPIDCAAQCIYDLLSRPKGYGGIYHITAGREKSLTLDTLLTYSYDLFGEMDDEWKRRAYPRTLIVDAKTFDLFLQTADEAHHILIKEVLSTMRYFAYQLSFPKEFSQENLRAIVPEFQAQLPHVCSYFRFVLKYCIEVGFKKP